jgi:hypothetical protein
MTAPETLSTGIALAARLESWIPPLVGGEIPKSAGQEIVKGLARAELKLARQAALQAILGIVDPDGSMSLTAATTVIAERLEAFQGVPMKRVRKGARPATELESLLMVLIEIPGPRCQRKLWQELGGKWPKHGR